MTLVTHRALELQSKADSLNEAFKGLAAQQIIDRVLNGRVAGSVAVAGPTTGPSPASGPRSPRWLFCTTANCWTRSRLARMTSQYG